jgi:hypothetical protein
MNLSGAAGTYTRRSNGSKSSRHLPTAVHLQLQSTHVHFDADAFMDNKLSVSSNKRRIVSASREVWTLPQPGRRHMYCILAAVVEAYVPAAAAALPKRS